MGWLRGNRKLQVGLLLLAPFLLAAIMPGVLAPHSPDALLDVPFAHPSGAYLLGTDEDGRDILSRLIYAARSDLAISLSATLIAAVIGVSLGLAAGYRGGGWSTACLRVSDVMLAFPSLLLALFLIAVVGPSNLVVVAALAILYIPGFMRFARGLALQLRERSSSRRAASRAAGRSHRAPPPAPERGRPAARQHLADRRLLAARGGDPVLPRPRRAAAGAELGLDVQVGLQLPLPGLVVRRDAGRLHRDRLLRLPADQRRHRARDPASASRTVRATGGRASAGGVSRRFGLSR